MDDVIDNDIDARGFSVKTGYYLAYASTCAYEELGGWADKLGLGHRVRLFTCDEFHGFVGFLNKVILVAFRGTQSVGNCLTDAETPLVCRSPYPGRVHSGFSEAVDIVWPEIQRLIGPPSRAKPLWLTGHSLGGAMATLASVRLASEGYNVRAVYTYGSPRVGDRLFRDFFRLPHYRFVHDNDLIPHLPFRWCYKHVGQLEFLDEEGNLTEERAVWEGKKQMLRRKAKQIQRAHGRAVSAHHEFTDFDWLSDHRLDRYLEALLKLLARVPRRRPDPPEDLLFGPAIASLGSSVASVDRKAMATGAPLHAVLPPGRPNGSGRVSIDSTLHRVDAASPGAPPSHVKQAKQRKLVISEADLADAFGSQPANRASAKDAKHRKAIPAKLPKELGHADGPSSRSTNR